MSNVRQPIVCVILFCLLGTYLPSVVVAQTKHCKDRETSLDCLIRLLDEVQALEAEADLDEMTQDRMTAAAAGGNVSTVQNFLPAFLASLGLDGVEEGSGDLRLTYNLEQSGSVTVSLEAIAHEPEVFEPLRNALPEESREEIATRLSEDLADFDDFEARLLFAIKNNSGGWRAGRDLAQYAATRERLFGTIRASLTEPIVSEVEAARSFLQAGVDSNSPPRKLSEQEKIFQLATATAARHTTLAERLESNKFYKFADLVANQPQIYVSASVRDRTEHTGPDEWSIKGSLELSLGNVNGLLQDCKEYEDDNKFLECYQKFVRDKASAIRHGWRFKLDAELKETDEYAPPAIPESDVNFRLDEVTGWTGAFSFGRSLKVVGTTEVSRFDLEAKWEDMSDPMRQARFLSTATLTQRLTDDVSVSASAVYANRPEYRGEVDKDFSLRAGLRFKVNRKSKTSSSSGGS